MRLLTATVLASAFATAAMAAPAPQSHVTINYGNPIVQCLAQNAQSPEMVPSAAQLKACGATVDDSTAWVVLNGGT